MAPSQRFIPSIHAEMGGFGVNHVMSPATQAIFQAYRPLIVFGSRPFGQA